MEEYNWIIDMIIVLLGLSSWIIFYEAILIDVAGEMKSLKLCEYLIKLKKHRKISKEIEEHNLEEHIKDIRVQSVAKIQEMCIRNLENINNERMFMFVKVPLRSITEKYNSLYASTLSKTLKQIIKEE